VSDNSDARESGWAEILALGASDAQDLARAAASPARQQSTLLSSVLRENATSAFGREHGFAAIGDVSAYRRAVPVRDPAQIEPWISRLAHGESNVLTSDAVVAFEETSGTSSGSKLVPYTRSSLRAFRAAILPWLTNLAQRRKGITRGLTYIAVSPVTRVPRRLPCGIEVGLPSDAAYLGPELMASLGAIMMSAALPDARRSGASSSAAPPPAQSFTPQTDAIKHWRIATLASLVNTESLSFISIWSPTFLLELIEALPAEAECVLRALHDSGADGAARRLQSALASRPIDTRRLWPQLDTISMWTDGASAPYAKRLTEYFPDVHVDGKGLLSTESAVTLRIDDGPGCVPALTSAFIEFVDEAGECRMAHELESGATYRVVITTPGGLYRYDTADLVRCAGIANGLPRLQFVGRSGLVSDLVGEKLTEGFVSHALSDLTLPAALVPQGAPHPHYEIWIDAPDSGDGGALAHSIDARLRRNVQYAYARDLGQLRLPVTIFHPGFAQYRRHMLVAQGRRLGDVKLSALIADHTTLPMRDGTAP
jgi:hypothetical protein